MANIRSQAQFDRAKWRLMILLPFWMIQLCLTMTMVGLFAWRLGDTMKTYVDQDKKGGLPAIEVAWEATNIGLAFIATVATIFEIARYFAESLTPWTMLFTHVIKMTCAAAIMVLDIIVIVQRRDRHYSLVGLGVDGAFIITACILVIYSVQTYRRLSVYDDYAHPVNVKPFGFHDGMDRDLSYSSKTGVRPSLEQRFSSVSSRLSIGSTSIKNEQVPMERVDPAPSYYDHQRDTQFEEYRIRRGSIGAKKDGARTFSGDFSSPGSPTSIQEEWAKKNRPRGYSGARAASWASERGLVAVPEEDDDEAQSKSIKDVKDHEALLGNSPRESVEGQKVLQEVDLAEPKWKREQQ